MTSKVPVWRLQSKNHSGYTYRYMVGNRPHRNAVHVGDFYRCADPITGMREDTFTYWGNVSWPQPDYDTICAIRPQVTSDGV